MNEFLHEESGVSAKCVSGWDKESNGGDESVPMGGVHGPIGDLSVGSTAYGWY